VGFETTISADDRPQSYGLDSAATGTGYQVFNIPNDMILKISLEFQITTQPEDSMILRTKHCVDTALHKMELWHATQKVI
jgi:hypothetical protein